MSFLPGMFPGAAAVRIAGAAPGDTFAVLAAAYKAEETATTITISGIDFGAGGHIVFAFAWSRPSGTSNVTVDSVAINGTAATIHVRHSDSGSANGCFIASASGVASGSGSITITYSDELPVNGVYGVYRAANMVIGATDNTIAFTTSIDDAVAVSAGGCVVGAAVVLRDDSTSDYATGVDTDHRTTIAATNRPGYVGSRFYAAGTTASVTTTTTGSNAGHRHALASFNPA